MIYEYVKKYMNKYPGTVAWRIKEHCKVAEMHMNPGETVIYAFAGQKNESSTDLFHTFIIVLTNKRIMLARKRVVFGYFFYSITPDMFNDLTVESNILWGRISIDTIKEEIIVTNLSKKSLPEIETNISEYMIKLKKELNNKEQN